MSYMPKKIQALTDLEQFDLLVAAFPDRGFPQREDDGDALWDEVMDLWEEITNDPEQVADLLARLVYLTMPMGSAMSGQTRHVLGVPNLRPSGTSVLMVAVVQRETVFNRVTEVKKS